MNDPRPAPGLLSEVPQPPSAESGTASASAATPASAGPDPGPVLPEPQDPPRVLLHMPVDVRSASLALLTVLACLAALKWAQAVLIPLMIGLMVSYALAPMVDWMQRRHVPRTAGAALLMVAILGSLGGIGYALADDAAKLVETLPMAAEKVRESLRQRRATAPGPLETMQKAASQLEQAAEESGAAKPAAARGVQRVVVEKPRFQITDYLWSGTVGLAALVGQATVVIFLAFFMLASGDLFRRKLVKIVGSSLTQKKVTVQALDEIDAQIQRYLLVQAALAVLVGVATWLSFWALGLEYAAVWGVAAGVLNLVPYIGSIAVTAAAALVAFVQFASVDMALAIGGASMLINIVEGNLLMPWLTSRASRMNAVAVFVGVLAWGWLWGIWGLLLGIPILMIAKAICDRVEDLKPIGELLGD